MLSLCHEAALTEAALLCCPGLPTAVLWWPKAERDATDCMLRVPLIAATGMTTALRGAGEP